MKGLFLFFVLTVSILMQGCDGFGAMMAFLGMGVQGALADRPDREINFKIDVLTNNNDLIAFVGGTFCPHHVNQDGHGYYATEKISAISKVGEQTWILEGISCDDVILEKKDTNYKLFKVVNEKFAKIYFIKNEEGNAHIKDSKFNVSFAPTRKAENHDYSSDANYRIGPYFYKKTVLKQIPAFLKNKEQPVVIYPGSNLCGRSPENDSAISLADDQLREVNFDLIDHVPNIFSYEQGQLEYDQLSGYWITKPILDLASPLDAAQNNKVTNQDGKQIWDVQPGCVKFLFNKKMYIISEHSQYSRLYVPDESAIYSVEYVWHSTRSDIIKSLSNWNSCEKPSTIDHLNPGTNYMAINAPYNFKYVRINEDGTYSCTIK